MAYVMAYFCLAGTRQGRIASYLSAQVGGGCKCGGAEGIRTPDLLMANETARDHASYWAQAGYVDRCQACQG